jgi:ABC-type Na+ efflux pump permease subunit
LSAWYAAFFSAVYIFLFFSTDALFGKYLKINFINRVSYLFKSFSKLVLTISFAIFSLLTALWIYIYLPVASDVDRDLQELIEGSPKFGQ